MHFWLLLGFYELLASLASACRRRADAADAAAGATRPLEQPERSLAPLQAPPSLEPKPLSSRLARSQASNRTLRAIGAFRGFGDGPRARALVKWRRSEQCTNLNARPRRLLASLAILPNIWRRTCEQSAQPTNYDENGKIYYRCKSAKRLRTWGRATAPKSVGGGRLGHAAARSPSRVAGARARRTGGRRPRPAECPRAVGRACEARAAPTRLPVRQSSEKFNKLC